MQDEEFEWDDNKARTNLTSHKIDFDDAQRVFDDPGMVEDDDDTMDYGEERYRAVGIVDGQLITVFYTFRAARVRIISAKPREKEACNPQGDE